MLARLIQGAESGVIILPENFICKLFDAKKIVDNDINKNIVGFESEKYNIDYHIYDEGITAFTGQAQNNAGLLISFYKKSL